MSSEDLEIETVPGLPHELPKGERLLWQGRPSWRALARQTFRTRWVMAYFAVLVAVRAVDAIAGGKCAGGVVSALFLAGMCLGLLNAFAYFQARATVYSITTKRVVLRSGVALPITWNLPFRELASADLVTRRVDDGDIVMTLRPPNRIGWLFLWPHVAPWRPVRARPALRALPEPAAVAAKLADAVAAWSREAEIALTVNAPTLAPAEAPLTLVESAS